MGSAALVLALAVFAASPGAHRWLHAHDDDEAARETPPASDDTSSHTCPVVLFANGVSLPIGPLALTPPTPSSQAVSSVTAAEVFLTTPRYLRQPERGPPTNAVS